jgi:hypothetical protein
MTRSVRRPLKDVLGLSEEDRVQIATEVLASLDEPPDAGWDDAWASELAHRQETARKRDEPGADWVDVRARVLACRGQA